MAEPPSPPWERPVRVLSLDGGLGGAKAFNQIKIIRALMEDIWRRENPGRDPTLKDIDGMLPHKHFDLIIANGTGAIIAVYLGRFRLTIKQCEDAYEELCEEVFGHPCGWEPFWRSDGNKYSHMRLESIVQKQTNRYRPFEYGIGRELFNEDGKTVEFCEMGSQATRCRVAVLAARPEDPNETRILRTYGQRRVANTYCYVWEAPDLYCYIWEAIRATTASHRHFPQINCGGEPLVALDGCMNPAWVAKEEVWRAFGHFDIACLISIGNGKMHDPALVGRGWIDKAPAAWQFLRTGNPDQTDSLWEMTKGCEFVDEYLGRDESLEGKYFRFNLEAGEGVWKIVEWSQENKELVLRKVGKTKLEVNLAAQSDDPESQSYLENLNIQQAIEKAVALL